MTSKVIQVIEAIGTRGVGTIDNPHRVVRAYFTLDGEVLAEYDPIKGWWSSFKSAEILARAARTPRYCSMCLGFDLVPLDFLGTAASFNPSGSDLSVWPRNCHLTTNPTATRFLRCSTHDPTRQLPSPESHARSDAPREKRLRAMFVSTALAERLVEVCEDAGANLDERLAALQIAITLTMRGFRSTDAGDRTTTEKPVLDDIEGDLRASAS